MVESILKDRNMKARIKRTNQIVNVCKGVFEYLAENGQFYKENELEFFETDQAETSTINKFGTIAINLRDLVDRFSDEEKTQLARKLAIKYLSVAELTQIIAHTKEADAELQACPIWHPGRELPANNSLILCKTEDNEYFLYGKNQRYYKEMSEEVEMWAYVEHLLPVKEQL